MLQAARGSCAAHSLGCATRPAAVSRQRGGRFLFTHFYSPRRLGAARSQQNNRAAAAASPSQSFHEAQQALSGAVKLLQAPRINKKMALRQLEIVGIYEAAAEGEAAKAEEAAQLEVAMAKAAAAAAVKDAQHDAALTKALAAAKAEAAKAAVEAAKAVAAAEAEAAKAAVKAAQHEAALTKLQLKDLVADYLRLQGALHARGLFEFAEQQLFAPLDLKPKPDRATMWAQLGQRHPRLEARILAANPAWRSKFIPAKAVQLYSQLSGQVHMGDPTASKVLLVEGPLSREDICFLECLAEEVCCPCELRYRELPAAIS